MLEDFTQILGGAAKPTSTRMILFSVAILIFIIFVIAGAVAGVLSVQKASVENQNE